MGLVETRKVRAVGVVAAGLGAALVTGCATPEQTTGLVGAVSATGFYAPAHELEQTYYIGVLDPLGQVPPALYRVRVHGQTSLFASTKFVSGWVPAAFADSLSSKIDVSFDDQGEGSLTLTDPDVGKSVQLDVGRRLMLFGPEGFQPGAKDKRLIIAMGSSAQRYFDEVNKLTAQLQAQLPSRDAQAREEKLKSALQQAQTEAALLAKARGDLKLELGKGG